MRGLRQQAGRSAALLSLPVRWLPGGRGAQGPGDSYSRRVVLLKRVLPAIGLALLLLVAAWPRIRPLIESVRLGFPAIDLREARELKMVNPRYAGVDRHDRPYVVTAAIGRQVPDRDDLMSLEAPKADMTLRPGNIVLVTAASGIYQSQAQLLDLFDDVNLVREDGTRFVTQSAHVNLTDNTADGHDPVIGHGPSGDVTAQGFRILANGDTIIFTGTSDVVLKGSKPSVSPAHPAALPSGVTKTAAQIEAAAFASPAAAPAKATGESPAIAKSSPATRKARGYAG